MAEIDRDDVQGNILEGYGYPHSLHLFARFADQTSGRRALAQLLPMLTRATPWRDGQGPETTLNLGLSFAGLAALGVSEESLAHFPEAFRMGMRARAAELGDDPQSFEAPWNADAVHLWVALHARDHAGQLQQLAAKLRAALAGDLLAEQRGSRVLNAQQQPIEHFGFRDGVSRPSIVGSLTPARPGDGTPQNDGSWQPLATGEFLLGHVDESGARAELDKQDPLGTNGTFAVFRKLGQNVAAFRGYAKERAQTLSSPDEPPVAPEWIEERMVGRKRDGRPLGANDAIPEDALNAFGFGQDGEGRVCPLGAHIRRANPRDAHAFPTSFARHRLLRRGMPFGPGLSDEQYKAGEKADPYATRGLLFIALNADYERQFEFLQRFYMNDGAAARQGRDADPLVGVHRERGSNFVIPGDPQSQRDTLICAGVPAFVKCLGGEYFFVPGGRALEQIAGSAALSAQVEAAAKAEIAAAPKESTGEASSSEQRTSARDAALKSNGQREAAP